MDRKFDIGEIIEYKRNGEAAFGISVGCRGDEIQIVNDVSSHESEKESFITVSKDDLGTGNIDRALLLDVDFFSNVDYHDIIGNPGKLKSDKINEILRKMVFSIVEKHYNVIHRKEKRFSPGETYIPYSGRVYDSNDMKTLVDCSMDFWLTSGRYSELFENRFAKFLKVKYCMLTNSGSSANLLAVSALTSQKIKETSLSPGDEVITVACGFPTTVNPIIQNNLTPVFLDIKLDGTYNINTALIEDAITEKTKAIFLAHTLGNPFELDKIMSLAKKHNLWVIEDNCDAVGSKYNDKYTGTFGDISTFSFYPPHHITMGEGGALATDDWNIKRIIESFRDWGRDCWCKPGQDNSCKRRFSHKIGDLPYGYDHKYVFSHIGYNLKITDMQASLGVAQLEKLERFIEARKRNWKLLYDGLESLSEYFILPKATEKSDPSWFGFILTVRKDSHFSRNEITEHLENKKIATRLLFSGNIIRHPSLNNVKYRTYGNLDNTDYVMNNSFWIGVYPGLSNEMIQYMINTIKGFVDMKVRA